MITRRIREFVSRDWTAARECKDGYWAERIERLGPLEGWRIADELRRQALRLVPNWPENSREEDLRFHVRFVEVLRRVGATRRP